MNWTRPEELQRILAALGGGETITAVSNPTAARDAYHDAVIDMLRLFGLVAQENDQIKARSDGAALFLKSMAAHLTDDSPLALDWTADLSEAKRKTNSAAGSQILATLEALRKDSIEHPTPIRAVTAVNGLITRRLDAETHLLMQFDEKAGQFQLIGGKAEPEDADIQATLLREMQEELERPDLRIPDHFQLAPLPQKFEETSLSPTFGVITGYLIHFFYVENMRFTPTVDTNTAWINLREVKRGATHDGRKVSDLPLMFAHVLETLPPSVGE